jgi:ribosome maturation factor RimP
LSGLEAAVEAIVRKSAEAIGYDVIDLKIDGRRHVRVWIDRDPGGVKIQDCVTVNRAANRALEEGGIDPGSFQIEVLSPGLDRPLKRPKDFERWAGSTITVRTSKRRAGERHNWKGKLVGFRDGRVVIHEEGSSSETSFALDDIEESRLVPDLGKKHSS